MRANKVLENLQPLGWFLVPTFLGLAIAGLIFGQTGALCSVQERGGKDGFGSYQSVYVVDGPGLLCANSGPFETKQEAKDNKAPGVSQQSDLVIFSALLIILSVISIPLFWERRPASFKD
jgi:hypothetical protein